MDSALLLSDYVTSLAGMVPWFALVVPADRTSDHPARLIMTDVPQGLPRDRLELPPITGVHVRQVVRIGRALDADIKLLDERAHATHCRVVRSRFGDELAHVVVSEGCEVLLDGVSLPPGRTPLQHMARLRIGEYEIQFRASLPAVPMEVLCRDGRYIRGRPRNPGWEGDNAVAVQPLEHGARAQTIPFAHIEQVRLYRSPAMDQRMRRIPGIDFVGGPLVLVRFRSGRTLTGRLERAEDAGRARFPVFTKEHGALDRILVVAEAAVKITVQEGTETPPKAKVSSGKHAPRSRLATPGPTAVGEQDIREQLERAHAEESEAETRSRELPRRTRPKPRTDEDERYIDRRGKPRI